jgi:hypothetical protein
MQSIRPNLVLKAPPRQPLGYLVLDIVLPSFLFKSLQHRHLILILRSAIQESHHHRHLTQIDCSWHFFKVYEKQTLSKSGPSFLL